MKVFQQDNQRRQHGDHHATQGDALGDRAFERDQNIQQVGFWVNDHEYPVDGISTKRQPPVMFMKRRI
ncbi:hypothetical protein D3C81_1984840 [compost metagenome]